MRLILAFLLRHRGCSCDRRFIGVAHDLDCPMHGIAAELRRIA